MNKVEVLEILNEISNYLDKGKYKEADHYINRKKEEIEKRVDPAGEYMDNLIQDLK
ncbi:MAG: hypothetical protein HFJ23_07820 [Clostridia bacterium]|nr:hypothetical protein [Clostridia bacterium]